MKACLRISLLINILILAAACGSGCTSVNIKSNKDATAVRKINRLFVLINHGEIGKPTLSQTLAGSLKNCLSNSPVQLAISIASPLELDEQSHLKEIEAFHADAVAVVQVKTFIVNEMGGYPTILYDVSLYDPAMKKRLWRAVIDNSGGTALMKRRMREMAEKIVQQLTQDGFL